MVFPDDWASWSQAAALVLDRLTTHHHTILTTIAGVRYQESASRPEAVLTWREYADHNDNVEVSDHGQESKFDDYDDSYDAWDNAVAALQSEADLDSGAPTWDTGAPATYGAGNIAVAGTSAIFPTQSNSEESATEGIAALQALTVEQLKERLRADGLSTKGKKLELVQRLLETRNSSVAAESAVSGSVSYHEASSETIAVDAAPLSVSVSDESEVEDSELLNLQGSTPVSFHEAAPESLSISADSVSRYSLNNWLPSSREEVQLVPGNDSTIVLHGIHVTRVDQMTIPELRAVLAMIGLKYRNRKAAAESVQEWIRLEQLSHLSNGSIPAESVPDVESPTLNAVASGVLSETQGNLAEVGQSNVESAGSNVGGHEREVQDGTMAEWPGCSFEEASNMTVTQIRELLKSRGMPIYGTKSVLVGRLFSTEARQAHGQNAEAVDVEPSLERTSSSESMSEESYAGLTVVQLRVLLKSASLPVHGSKATLVARALSAFGQQ